ncbi:methyltransferase domain-containing protein [Rhodococcus triatomae]|uniref:23S rRNA (Guanine745-N1)-methyltransferase n=1 Tax=Rhodococcus triatomae TaxID=300028 RepID=A0A1G7ZBQ9_9NOCA|nr:methyltransferase domain-containing protein [Rhodococcus triatomae]QNG18071.1 methyltransferase domain-containing protein [Rhodococcus triatomae]QNG22259.1 methyltransferase domain-containing protein [Rhodococcus triatomae]SDH06124.1 23S rRNA (guanine745-N1)-methyltransferase [Rhodococcus triatomae]
MLAEVIDLLACPQCAAPVDLEDGTVVCERGHTFDVARQGYVTLLTGAATKFEGDSAEMISCRANFLSAGHFDGIVAELSEAVGGMDDPAPRLLEIGAGTGHYLAGVLDATTSARGIGLDVSKFAARRLAKSHPRAGAVVADAWRALPVRDGALSHVLCVFAPRNAAETHRVLDPGGELIVVGPTERHLAELVGALAMVQVDDRKVERLDATTAGRFTAVDRRTVEYTMRLGHDDIVNLVGMGPSARHLTPAGLAESVARLPEPLPVTASVTISRYRRVAAGG